MGVLSLIGWKYQWNDFFSIKVNEKFCIQPLGQLAFSITHILWYQQHKVNLVCHSRNVFKFHGMTIYHTEITNKDNIEISPLF